MDFALFIILVVIGAVGFIRRSITFLGLGIAIFFALALFMFAKTPVIINENTTAQVKAYDSANFYTGSKNATADSHTNILQDNYLEVAWIFMMLAFALVFLFVRGLFTMSSWA